MITILVKEPETNIKEDRLGNIILENSILKAAFIESVRKQEQYKDLLKEGLELLDKQKEEIERVSYRINMWSDEAVRLYNEQGNLDKVLKILNREILMYELTKIKEEI
ncbi:hypothetical protein [Clostridium oceanicum]|uniref:Uncharacterized protein n=1 Tax=Clostridium oceanicum TaxID=1543 RepID=A0ABN1JCB2_9CLOT